jgi:phosphonate transport system permease protein
VSTVPEIHRFTSIRPPKVTFIGATAIAALGLIVGSWVFVLGADRVQSQPFFSVETLERGGRFLQALLGIGSSSTPAFAQWAAWQDTARLAYQTLAMSVLAIGIAALIALATFMFGASNIMRGELAPYRSWVWGSGFFVVRAFYTFTRAIPELVWAMLIIFMFAPGLLPGALALGIHNAGVLGKLSSEVVEGLDTRPLLALRSSGAGRFQVLAYGVLPQALPRFITYLFYRWELIIRTTIVVGFVAAGGLGLEFRLSMSYFHYTTVTLLLIWYLVLVVAVDLIAAVLRRMAR